MYHRKTGVISQVGPTALVPTACKLAVRQKTRIVITPRYIGLVLGIRRRVCAMKEALATKALRSSCCQNELDMQGVRISGHESNSQQFESVN